jgi:hypothetical protein
MKKCCNGLDKIAIRFVDISSQDDSDLRLLGNMLRACNNDLLESESLQVIGFKIIEYLNRKILKDHLFWGRPLTSYSGSDKELKIDLHSLRELLKD